MTTVLMVEPADDQRDLTIRSGGAVARLADVWST
jgi:hypothetical protein